VRTVRMPEGFGQPMNLGAYLLERPAFAVRESIGGVAVRTAQIASGQAHKDAGQPREGTFALKTQIDLVDDQCFGHATNSTITANRRTGGR